MPNLNILLKEKEFQSNNQHVISVDAKKKELIGGFKDDLHYNRGEFGQMLGRIGSKTGLSQAQLRHKILNWDDSPFRTF